MRILTLTNSTISNNVTGNGSGFNDGFSTGGSGGGIANSNVLTLTNCTVVGNQTSLGVVGAGLDPNIVTAGNGGGVWAASESTVNLRNTIIANNTVAPGGSGPDLKGTFNSQDYNLIKDISGASFNGTTAHNVVNIDPLLAALGDYGGSTQTFA
jgi:hypothetical protein